MTVLSGQTLMVTSVTFYYYPPHLSTLTSVRGVTALFPASSPVRVQKTGRHSVRRSEGHLFEKHSLFPPTLLI